MRSDIFISTVHMVCIYGRKYDIIFKYAEKICQGRIHVGYHNHNKPATDFYIDVSYLFIYLGSYFMAEYRKFKVN